MERFSRTALVMLVQSLDAYRHKVISDIKSGKYSSDETYELEKYIIQIDGVFGELEEQYDECRAQQPDMMPFSELRRET